MADGEDLGVLFCCVLFCSGFISHAFHKGDKCVGKTSWFRLHGFVWFGLSTFFFCPLFIFLLKGAYWGINCTVQLLGRW